MPADDLTDPAPATSFAHLDATTTLSRAISELGIYPAVDPLELDQPRADPGGRRPGALRDRPRASRRRCSGTRACRTSSPSSAWTSFREEDKLIVSRARKIQRFLSQPFHVAEVFTGIPGKFVQVEDTVRSFKAVVNGEYDHLPGSAFYMVGGIEEAVAKAEKLAQEA